jgi:hypothetical protein
MFSSFLHVQERKNLYIKIKDRNPSIKITRKMRAQVYTTQRKKQKQTINENRKKKPYAIRIQGYEMMINDNKEDLT